MTIPHFADKSYYCEWCDTEIPIGYEAIMIREGCFCGHDCLTEYLVESADPVDIFLTNKKIHTPYWED